MASSSSRGGKSGGDTIRVVARFRPLVENERQKLAREQRHYSSRYERPPAIEFLDDGASVGLDSSRDLDSDSDRRHFFTFDAVLQPGTSQADVYETVARPSIESLMAGYNSTIFAYGQTGAGKTYTMMGTDEQPGIIPRTIQHIFEEIGRDGQAAGTSYQMRASFVEIYNEMVRDLLDPKLKTLRVRDMSGFSYIEDVQEVPIREQADVFSVLRRGNSTRSVGSHAMNDASSRSHSIFILYLSATTPDGNRRTGILNLCDLAGSEKIKKTQATGDTLKESVQINKSLSQLANCIQSLSEGKQGAVVAYRNSKLTQILQRSLGGNCKTTLVVACSPSETEVAESVNSCRFGQRAKAVKLSAKKNEQRCEALMRLGKQRKQLEAALSEAQRENATLWEDSGAGGGGDGERAVSILESVHID